MEYVTTGISDDQALLLMDAVRVAFVDDQNQVLGIAKLGMEDYTSTPNGLKAPLYLYNYSISTEELTKGSLELGERKSEDSAITSLEQSVAKAISVLVWLDGDIVDNSMVSAESETSLRGTLNLQFSSSADLIPAQTK